MACSANCSAACANGCKKGGTESSNQYEGCACGGCGFGCAGGGGCTNTCTGTCSGSCSGCGGSCTGSCTGTCQGSCLGKCLGSCVGACKGSCNGMCLGGCSTACSGTCNHLCNTTCSNSVAKDAYNFLNNLKDKLTKDDYNDYINHIANDGIVLNYLDSEDINYIFTLLKEEGRRRLLQLDSNGNPIGKKNEVFNYNILTEEQGKKIGGINNKVIPNNFADDQEIKKINNLLITNAGKSINLSSINSELVEGGMINRAIGVALIKKMLEAYQDMVGVPSVSQSAGVQEN